MGDDLIRRLGVSAVILIAFTVTLYAFGNLFYNHNKSVPTFWRNGHDPSDDSRSDYFQESWTPPKQTTNFTASNWEFDPDVDGRSYSLTDEQCDIAFPGLFSEIEQSVMSRLGNPITSEDLDENVHNDSNTRAMIYDGDLYIIEGQRVPEERALAVLSGLHRSIVAHPNPREIPNIEFVFGREDWVDSEKVCWALTRREEHKNTWLVPDFGFYSWPMPSVGPYQSVIRKVKDIDAQYNNTLANKIPKLVWRGALWVNQGIRGALVDNSRDKPWGDVLEIDFLNPESARNLLKIEDHCKYQFIAHTEGNSYSGRQKYIQLCKSIVVSHPLEWLQPFHHFMVASGPEQNYVRVRSDYSDLDEKMQFYLDNPAEAERVAENSVKTFRNRYLTPAASACYWRRLIHRYSLVSFEPDFYEDLETTELEKLDSGEFRDVTKVRRKWRGTPFENYILRRAMDGEPAKACD